MQELYVLIRWWHVLVSSRDSLAGGVSLHRSYLSLFDLLLPLPRRSQLILGLFHVENNLLLLLSNSAFSTTWHPNEPHNFRCRIFPRTSQVSLQKVHLLSRKPWGLASAFHIWNVSTFLPLQQRKNLFVRILCTLSLPRVSIHAGEISYFVYSCQANIEY